MAEEKVEPKVETAKPEVKPDPKKSINNNHAVFLALGVGLVLFVLVGSAMAIGGRFMHNGDFNSRIGNGGEFRTNMPMRGGNWDGQVGGRRMMGQNSVVGKVTAVDGKKFSIDVSGTKYDVQIGDTTRFSIDSAISVKVGDTVRVIGAKDSSGVIQATLITVASTS